jgi:hypothetical protein
MLGITRFLGNSDMQTSQPGFEQISDCDRFALSPSEGLFSVATIRSAAIIGCRIAGLSSLRGFYFHMREGSVKVCRQECRRYSSKEWLR